MILNKERLNDFDRLIKTNDRLNHFNTYLAYLFHIFNIGGSFIITYATTVDDKQYKWIGIGLNSFGQLIYLIEKLNLATLKQNQKDMIAIKSGTYNGEGATPEVDPSNESQDDGWKWKSE